MNFQQEQFNQNKGIFFDRSEREKDAAAEKQELANKKEKFNQFSNKLIFAIKFLFFGFLAGLIVGLLISRNV